MLESIPTGYSAKVRLWLEYRGNQIPLGQVAPDWVMPVDRCELDACEVIVVVEVDGVENRRRVALPVGGVFEARELIEVRTPGCV